MSINSVGNEGRAYSLPNANENPVVKTDKNKDSPIVKIANSLVYSQKLAWARDSAGDYACLDGNKNIANDFKLRYWTSGADVPKGLVDKVDEKFKQIKDFDPQLGEKEWSDMKIHYDERITMCCHDFCYYVLLESNVIDESQLNQVMSATYEKGASMGVALFANDYNRLLPVDLENPPAPGDVIVFKQPEVSRPGHYAIWAGNNEYIELHQDAVMSNSKENMLGSKERLGEKPRDYSEYNDIYQCLRTAAKPQKGIDMYYIPQSEIRENIQDFIDNNPVTKENKLSDQELREVLDGGRFPTQYKTLMSELPTQQKL